MNPILQALQSMGIMPKPQILSPLPSDMSPGGYNDPATDPGLANYYQQQYNASQITPQQAQQTIQQNTQPKTIQYPSWMANAPGGPTLASQMQWLPPTPQIAQKQQANPIQQAIGLLAGNKPAQTYAEGYPKGATSYEKQAAQIFDKYGVPPSIGLGVWAMEGRGKTINPNNPYNIGAYDTNPQNANAYKFSSPLEGTNAAAQFLAGQSPYQTAAVKKVFQNALANYKKTGDQNAYLKAIAPVYSTNPNYAKTITQTPEYQRWSYNQ